MTFKDKLSREQKAKLLIDCTRMRYVDVAAKYGVDRHTVYRIRKAAAAEEDAKPPRELKPCGTIAALRRHRRKGEYPCTKCLAKGAEETKRYKQRKKEQADGNTEYRRDGRSA